MFLKIVKFNEEGIALVVSLLTLLVLSLVATFAMNTAVLENMVAGNIRAYTDAFYQTEAALRETALGLKITPDNVLVSGTNISLPGNQQLSGVFASSANITDPNSVLQSRLNLVDNAMNAIDKVIPDYTSSKVKIVHGGPAPGSSLGIGASHGSSSRHLFFIFGRTKPTGAKGRGVLLEIGYLRRIRG